MKKYADLTGQRFGELVVLNYSHSNDGTYWNCICDCGKQTIVRATSLKYGSTKSCGCGSLKAAMKNIENHRNSGHGMSRTRINECWRNINRRCYKKNNARYINYGARGITVCDEWKNDFMSFYNWAMTNGYSDDLTIDRINNDGNYEPSNCRWATKKQQNNNTTRNIYISYKNETKTLAEWAEFFGLTYSTLKHRIERNWAIEKAFVTPQRNVS